MLWFIVIGATLVSLVWPSRAQERAEPAPVECVILLHGLARTPRSFHRLERRLREEGYDVVNLSYPSTEETIERSVDCVREKLQPLVEPPRYRRVHFVTHSMGGIVVRYYLRDHRPANLGRVVMLSPPNQGSELVEVYRNVALYEEIAGPAGLQLGTASNSVPNRLGPVDFEVGVIAGDRTLNPILSGLIPGADDGKVAVERTKVDGMADFLAVHHSHVFIMMRQDVQDQVVSFLRDGKFKEAR